jgi:hypothetical protein
MVRKNGSPEVTPDMTRSLAFAFLVASSSGYFGILLLRLLRRRILDEAAARASKISNRVTNREISSLDGILGILQANHRVEYP